MSVTTLYPIICSVCPEDTLEVTEGLMYIHLSCRDRKAQEGASVAMNPVDARALAKHLVELADKIDPSGAATAPAPAPAPKPKAIAEKKFSNLSAQSQLVYKHMQRAGSISAREAMNDYGITSSTLARRICDIQEEGFSVNRARRNHPINQRQYTRYSLV